MPRQQLRVSLGLPLHEASQIVLSRPGKPPEVLSPLSSLATRPCLRGLPLADLLLGLLQGVLGQLGHDGKHHAEAEEDPEKRKDPATVRLRRDVAVSNRGHGHRGEVDGVNDGPSSAADVSNDLARLWIILDEGTVLAVPQGPHIDLRRRLVVAVSGLDAAEDCDANAVEERDGNDAREVLREEAADRVGHPNVPRPAFLRVGLDGHELVALAPLALRRSRLLAVVLAQNQFRAPLKDPAVPPGRVHEASDAARALQGRGQRRLGQHLHGLHSPHGRGRTGEHASGDRHQRNTDLQPRRRRAAGVDEGAAHRIRRPGLLLHLALVSRASQHWEEPSYKRHHHARRRKLKPRETVRRRASATVFYGDATPTGGMSSYPFSLGQWGRRNRRTGQSLA
eukprot:scaffold438_cov250-Pinguiococcus_pyrenoidosus.AAC.24